MTEKTVALDDTLDVNEPNNGKQLQEKPPKDEPQGPDPFDPSRYRMSQNFEAAAGVKEALTTVPVKKPDKHWFIRTHPDVEAYRMEAMVIELREDRSNTYLVTPEVSAGLIDVETTLRSVALYTAISRQGVVFIWPVKLPTTDGRGDSWSKSAMTAANMAADRWVRVQADMTLGAYRINYSEAVLSEPKWPDKSFRDLIEIAFRDNVITSRDHPVLKQLRGEE